MNRFFRDFFSPKFFKASAWHWLVLVMGFWLVMPDAHAQPYNEKLCPAEFPEQGLLCQQSPMSTNVRLGRLSDWACVSAAI